MYRVWIMNKTKSVKIITNNVRRQHIERLARNKGLDGELVVCVMKDGKGSFMNIK